MNSQVLLFPDLLSQVATSLPGDTPVYLVGGAVRDALLGRPSHDLDFVMGGNVMKTARRVASALGAAFFPLDEERYTARLILRHDTEARQVLDFAALRGPDLESDLRARDFTINAMAVDASQPQTLIDPLGGADDLFARRLVACSPTALSDDPVRVLRAVRMAGALRLQILPETLQLVRAAVPLIDGVSPERLRDELFRILSAPGAAAGLRTLALLGALAHVLPELVTTQGIEQSPPHVTDVWTHSLEALEKLNQVYAALEPFYNQERAANLHMGLLVLHLGRYRQQIGEHIEQRLNPERKLRALMQLAILYHDIGKPQSKTVEEGGRIRFFGHEDTGAELVKGRGRQLRLSNAEIERLETIVQHHMRPFLLAQNEAPPTRKAVYRFFRATGPAGVDICLISLADVLATYQSTLPVDEWVRHLEVVRVLLEAWWERPQEAVSPPALVSGNNLMEVLNLQPGPLVGRLLESIREAQASGAVSTRQEALNLAEKLQKEWS